MASDQRSPDAAGAVAPMKLGAASLARSIGRGSASRGALGAPIRRAGDLATTISTFGRNLGGSLRSRPIRPSFSAGVPEVRFPAGVWAMPATEPEAPSDMDPAMAALQARLRQTKAPKKAPAAPPRRGLPSTLRRHGMSLTGPGTGPSGFVRRLAPADTFVPRNDGHFSTTPGRPRQIGPGAALNGAKPAPGPSSGWTSKPAPRPRFSNRPSSPATAPTTGRAARSHGSSSPRPVSGSGAGTGSRSAEASEGERTARRSHIRLASAVAPGVAPRPTRASMVRAKPNARASVNVAAAPTPRAAAAGEHDRVDRGATGRIVRLRRGAATPDGSSVERLHGVSGAGRPSRGTTAAASRPATASTAVLSRVATAASAPMSSRVATGASAPMSSLRRSATADARRARSASSRGAGPARSFTDGSDRPHAGSSIGRAHDATAGSADRIGGESRSARAWSHLPALAIGARRIASSTLRSGTSRSVGSLAHAVALVAPRRLPTAPQDCAKSMTTAASGWSARLQAAWSGPGLATSGPMQSVRYPALVGPSSNATTNSTESGSMLHRSLSDKASRPAWSPRSSLDTHATTRPAADLNPTSTGANRPSRHLVAARTAAQPVSSPITRPAQSGPLRLDRIHRHAQPLAGSRGLASLDRALPIGSAASHGASAGAPRSAGSDKRAAKALQGSAPTGDGSVAAEVWAARLQAAFGGNAEQAALAVNQIGEATSDQRSSTFPTSAGQPAAQREAGLTSRFTPAATAGAMSVNVAASSTVAARSFGQRWTPSSRVQRTTHSFGSASGSPSDPSSRPTSQVADQIMADRHARRLTGPASQPVGESTADLDVRRPAGSAWNGGNVAAAARSIEAPTRLAAHWPASSPSVDLASRTTPGIARQLAASTSSLPSFAPSTSTIAALRAVASISAANPSTAASTAARTRTGTAAHDTAAASGGNLDRFGRPASPQTAVAAPPTTPVHMARRRPVRERRAAALDVLRRSPALQARALPTSYRSLAAHVTTAPIRIAHDATAQAALSAAGVSAATVGRTILLDRAPTMAPHDRELVAHEMVHAAANTKIPRFFDDPHHDREERTAVSVGRLARSLSAETIRTAPVPPILGGPTGNGTGNSMVAPPPFGAHTAVAPPTGSTGMGVAASGSAAASGGPRPQIRRSSGGRSTTTLHRSSGSTTGSSATTTRSGGGAGNSLQRQAATGVSVASAGAAGGQQAAGSTPGAAPSGAGASSGAAPKGRSLTTTERLDQIEELAALIEARVLAELERRGGQHRGWI